MKKTSIAFLLLVLSVSSFAQGLTCLDKLLPYNRHSGLHQLTPDEWRDENESLTPEKALVAVTFLTNSKLFCRTGEVVIKLDPFCGRTLQDLPESNSCFVFTNLGYFILTRDHASNTNFIFTKDSRYSETP